MLVYSDKYKLAYLSVPKSGCTTFKNIMCKLDDKNFEYLDPPTKIHPFVREKKQKRNTEEYYIFTFVRNPVDRFLSFYIRKIREPWFKKYGVTDKTDIIEFFDLIKKFPSDQHDEHFCTQSSIIYGNEFNVNFIGKLESSDYYWDILKEKFNIKLDLFKSNESDKSIKSEFKNNLIEEEIRLIENFYKDDFKNFEYVPNIINL